MRAAFYTGTRAGMAGIYNRLVRFYDKGKYSHCELEFSDGMSASASYMDGGIRFKRIDYDPKKWDFIVLSPEMEPAARAWFAARDGRAYDLLGNLRFLIGPLPLSRDKWFCSSALAGALAFAEGWRLSPNALHAVLEQITRKQS